MATIVLRQHFPLGRFHANPWKAFPFDDPFGEWPPSPWRLIRALIARSYQFAREGPEVTADDRAALVRAFCESSVRWHLPEQSWRGPGLRQYQPAEFSRVPKSAKEPGRMAHSTTKNLDNYWLTAGSDGSVWWFLDAEHWGDATLQLLDACLARMTYFGRAESITLIQRANGESLPKPNCSPLDRRTARSVPVLFPTVQATLTDIERITDDPAVAEATVPPGAIWRFAERPERPPLREIPRRIIRKMPEKNFLQFAIGSRVSPGFDAAAIMTHRFRGRIVQKFLGESWRQASPEKRTAVALLAGKDADGKPLEGHHHAYFALWFEPEMGKAARLLAWRRTPFSNEEQRAILAAAELPLSLGYNEKGKDPWTIHLVPLDSAVPSPAGFAASERFTEWATMTPFVPPQHIYNRQGKEKPGKSIEAQINAELANHGFKSNEVVVQFLASKWVKIHRPRSESRDKTNTAKRGHHLRLTFSTAVGGPIALGNSCHFGLGLFVPVS